MTFNQWENWGPEQVKGLESDIQLAVGSSELESTPHPLMQGLFSTFPLRCSHVGSRFAHWSTLQSTPRLSAMPDAVCHHIVNSCTASTNGVIIFLHDDISYGSANLLELRPILVCKHHWNPKGGCLIAASLNPLRRSQKYLQGFHSRSLMMVLTNKGKREGNYQGI